MQRLAEGLRALPQWVIWLGGLVPLAWVIWLTLSAGLGVDPVREVEHRLGKIALWFLVGGYAITPLRSLTGLNLLRHRRTIGLLAFLYVMLHLLAWAFLDMGMRWSQAGADLIRRPYLLLGIIAFLLMVPLALTSSNRAIRALGRNWRKLHLLTHAVVVLGLLHWLWQMKIVTAEGWIWVGIALLLGIARLRFPRIRARER